MWRFQLYKPRNQIHKRWTDSQTSRLSRVNVFFPLIRLPVTDDLDTHRHSSDLFLHISCYFRFFLLEFLFHQSSNNWEKFPIEHTSITPERKKQQQQNWKLKDQMSRTWLSWHGNIDFSPAVPPYENIDFNKPLLLNYLKNRIPGRWGLVLIKKNSVTQVCVANWMLILSPRCMCVFVCCGKVY